MFIRFCKATVTVVPRHFRQVVQKAAGEEGARRHLPHDHLGQHVRDSHGKSDQDAASKSNGFNHMHLSMQRLLVSKG